MCSEIITSIGQALPDFKVFNRYDDVFTNRLLGGPNGQSLDRRIKMQIPFYYIKKTILSKSNKLSNYKKIINYQNHLFQQMMYKNHNI